MMRDSKTSMWPKSVLSEFSPEEDSPPLDLRIGEILLHAKKLTPPQIEKVLSVKANSNVRFGDAAMALGFVSGEDVRWALSQQFHYPYALNFDTSTRPELVVASNPFGAQAEAIREVRTNLLMGLFAIDQPRRALAIVSPGKGEGKSFLAANLAASLSQLGARTLLVDGDLRTPRQHSIFEVENASGLSGALSGRQKASVIRTPDLPNLYLMTTGAIPPNPVELVQRSALGLLLGEFLRKFDFVIVDTPAARHGADARIVAATCGSALVVGRQNTSSLASLDALLLALTSSQTAIAGVLMNQH